MGLVGSAFLAIWHDLVPEAEVDFNRWHTREHMPERLAVPGFLVGRRYVAATEGCERYFNLYQGEALDVFSSPAYRARLDDPTPWTRANIPNFRGTVRGACRLVASVGAGTGGAMATVRFELDAGASLDSVAEELAREALELDGVTGAHVGACVREVTAVETGERALRRGSGEDRAFDAVLLVEAIGCDALAAHAAALSERTAALSAAGASPALGSYRLQYLL